MRLDALRDDVHRNQEIILSSASHRPKERYTTLRDLHQLSNASNQPYYK